MVYETKDQMLNEEGGRAQTPASVVHMVVPKLWAWTSGDQHCMAIYRPEAAAIQKSFWMEYHGYLETNGYQEFKDQTPLLLGHIRGYFIDAVHKGKEYDYSQLAMQGVQYCNQLFTLEDSINKDYPGDYEKRKHLYFEQESGILEAFWSLQNRQKPVPQPPYV